MISLELNSVRAKDADRAAHDSAIAEFLRAGGKVQAEEPSIEKPPEPRRAWIDPETVLNRKRRRLRPAESQLVRQITEAL